MWKKDYTTELDVKRAISPVVVTDNTPQVSQIIDTADAQGAVFLIMLGTLSDADTTVVALLEHGDAANLSDAAAVPDDMLNGTEVLAGFQFDDDNECRKLGYHGDKRYVRLTLTPANNTGNIPVSALVALLGLRRAGQASNPPA